MREYTAIAKKKHSYTVGAYGIHAKHFRTTIVETISKRLNHLDEIILNVLQSPFSLTLSCIKFLL